MCTQCFCQRVSLGAVEFLVWNQSANKYDIRYVCRLCWQHANFHLHIPFVKLHKKHRQLFAQNSSAKRTACLIVIQVVSRLKQTTRTTASTRINYPRKLLANNVQRNGTAHGNAGADRTGPGSGHRAPGSRLRAPLQIQIRIRIRTWTIALCAVWTLRFGNVIINALKFEFVCTMLQCRNGARPGQDLWPQSNEIATAMSLYLPLCLPLFLCISVTVCILMYVYMCLVTCKWMQRKWNEFVRGRKKRSVKRGAFNELRTLQTVRN